MRIFNSKDKNKLRDYRFTSESVSEGHPDKICDQISDALLDEYLRHDSNAKVAIEAMVTPNNVFIAGEVNSSFKPKKADFESKIRDLIKQIGYKKEPFSYQTVKITNLVHAQSPEITKGIQNNGAGDQGLMFGYACDETDGYMPAPIYYANKVMEAIIAECKGGKLKGLGMDAKCQITVEYDKYQRPYKISDFVLSIQHQKDIKIQDIKNLTMPIISNCLPDLWMCDENRFLVNPAGTFIVGGPQSDAGLTGRKIIVDTYGGAAPHGGGAFSGKDPSKVDRSAAYAARYLAKNIVASKIAKKCLIQISYAIGIAKPISIFIDTFGTSKVREEKLLSRIEEVMDLSPNGIIKHLNLDRPIYLQTSTYGHFGRVPSNTGAFSWEKLDIAEKF